MTVGKFFCNKAVGKLVSRLNSIHGDGVANFLIWSGLFFIVASIFFGLAFGPYLNPPMWLRVYGDLMSDPVRIGLWIVGVLGLVLFVVGGVIKSFS